MVQESIIFAYTEANGSLIDPNIFTILMNETEIFLQWFWADLFNCIVSRKEPID